MKEVIAVTVKTKKTNAIKAAVDLLAVGIFSDAKRLDKINAELNKKLSGAIEGLIKLGDFKGDAKSSAVVYGNTKIGAKRVLLLGLGEKKQLTVETIRDTAAMAANKAVELKAKTMALTLHYAAGKINTDKAGQAIAEGVYFGGYRYDEYVTKSKNGRAKSLSVELVDSDAANIRQLARGVSTGKTIGQAQAFARTLANRPANVINPPTLAAVANKMAKEVTGLSCKIFDESKLPTIGLVGKAITFDSGGISIKPSNGMQDMKFDKAGGIAVLATMKAIAELKLAVNVYGIIPSAENMPSATSYRPGDIITTFSGKTVEVQNTDAEGRLILCDGIHYAVTQKCDTIVDIATLTGACMVALGKYKAGLMGNDDVLIKKFQTASKDSGEKLWHLPCGDEYSEEMKSKIADLKNVGSRWGGACTAASFLMQFVGEAKWAHIDIAGVDMFEGQKKSGSVGATGFGVRLLTKYLIIAAEKTKKNK